MQDFTKQNMTKLDVSKKTETLKKQPNWLTKNRFWNLAFLFLIPAEICLCGIFDSLIPAALIPFTLSAMFGFITFDKSMIENKDPLAVKCLQYAAYIWFPSMIVCIACFFINIKPTFAGFIIPGFSSIYFALALSIFVIFLIPILILNYANIPLAACFIDSKQTKKPVFRRPTNPSRACVGNTDIPLSIRSQNFKK